VKQFARLLFALLGLSQGLWCQVPQAAAAPPAKPSITVTVVDSSGLPVPAAHVQLQSGGQPVGARDTDEQGQAVFGALKPALYQIAVSRDGFESVRKADVTVAADSALEFRLTIAPVARAEKVEVTATAAPVEQGATTSNTVTAATAKELPGRPATVSDALPLVPGVVRKPDGGLQISGAGEHRSALIVNSADVTDPATGQFGLTVPIDVVDTMNVYQTPFLAEYGKFSAGLVSVETRRGGDKWNWELNDPFPEFFIRSWRLRGLRDATPRINADGPILHNKLYFSEGLEYEIRKTEIYTLPFPDNLRKKSGVNSFAQLDWIQSQKHLITATVHAAPQRLDLVNLDYFNPPATTPDAGTHNYTATVSDRLNLLGGLLDNTFSATQFGARIWGKGPDDLVITPTGKAGNYFANQSRTANRFAWAPSFTLPEQQLLGNHTIKVGSYVSESTVHGQLSEHSISIDDAAFHVRETIDFTPGRAYQLDDTETAFYIQDHWSLSSRLAADLGVRVESQEVSHSYRVAPRAGLAWTPIARLGTVLRAGFGFFYDHVPLNVYAFNHYPKETLTYYDTAGNITAGPFFFGNALSAVNVRIPFVFRQQGPGNYSPQTATGSLQLEQPVTRLLKVRVGYIHSQAAGLVLLDQTPWDPVAQVGANQLIGSGQARYRQFEVTTRARVGEKRELFFSYVHSIARGDLNDFNNYLGSFPIPVIRPNQFSSLPGDLPDRFLLWGTAQLPHKFRIAPALEARSGFPYFALDAAQTYVGVPNTNRYPMFLSLDSRLSRDFKVSQKYSVRLSVTGYNLTNHFNPEAFHNNIADPAFGVFFGERHRRFTADFDVLF
jgi:hypothetical protein